MKNIKISHQVLAEHFEDNFTNERSAYESFRKLKRKWENEEKGLWVIYVKAYNYDILSKKLGY